MWDTMAGESGAVSLPYHLCKTELCGMFYFQVDQMAHSVKFRRAQEKKPSVVLYTYSPHAEIDKEGSPGPVS